LLLERLAAWCPSKNFYGFKTKQGCIDKQLEQPILHLRFCKIGGLLF